MEHRQGGVVSTPVAPEATHHAMFVLARESRGITQTELARRMGVAQGTVSKVENGTVEPTHELVEKFAHALNYPSRFFSMRIEQRNLPVTFYRKRKSLAASAVKRIEAGTNIRRLHLTTLLRSVEVAENRVPAVNLADGFTARQVASELRARWHVARGPIANLTKLLEDSGVLLIRTDFGTPLIDALSFYEARDTLPPIIFVSATCPGDRLRFTLAHELGHLVLHHHLPLPPVESESEADEFASEFLMPASDIRGYFTRVTLDAVFALKQHWRVSGAALIMRAGQLGRITERQKRYLFMQISSRGFRHEEPYPVARDEPTLLPEIVQSHCSELGYTDDELSEALCLGLAEFKELYRQNVGLRLVRS